VRDTPTRKADVLAALEKQGQVWLATAEVGGRPHVIAVSAWWDGTDLVVTTSGSSKTARNIAMNPLVTLAGGDPADAIVIQAQMPRSRPSSPPDFPGRWDGILARWTDGCSFDFGRRESRRSAAMKRSKGAT